MDIAFLSDDPGTPAFHHLAVGHPLPDFIASAEGEAGILYLPHAGIITVSRYAGLGRIQRRALCKGRWSVGVLPAGRHATLVHSEYSLAGEGCCLQQDLAFSAEHHRRASDDDVAEEVGEGTLLTSVSAEAGTDLVVAVRQTRLSATLGGALRSDLLRQAENAAEYTSANKGVEIMAAFARHLRVTREVCTAWEVVRDLPDATSKRKG